MLEEDPEVRYDGEWAIHCQRPSYRLGPQSTADGFDIYDKNNSIMVIYMIYDMIAGLPCMDFPHCGHQLGPRR